MTIKPLNMFMILDLCGALIGFIVRLESRCITRHSIKIRWGKAKKKTTILKLFLHKLFIISRETYHYNVSVGELQAGAAELLI